MNFSFLLKVRDRYRLLLLRAYLLRWISNTLDVEYHLQYSFILYFHLNLSNTATLYQKQYNSQKKTFGLDKRSYFSEQYQRKKKFIHQTLSPIISGSIKNRLERYCVQRVQASANILNSAMIRVFHERRLIRFLCRATMAEIIELQRGSPLNYLWFDTQRFVSDDY